MAIPLATTSLIPALASLTGRRLGEFQLIEEIGSGSFGVIYRAEQVGLRRAAVVKVLRPRFAGHETQQLRFLREARLASTLDHPYAAHVYAFGAEPDGLLWIAMELVRGAPLSDLLREGALSLATFVPFLERLCEVVHTSHEHGIVHRDIKPNNVMVITRAGALLPKLLDLGIAKDGADEQALAEAARFYQDALSTVRGRAVPEPPRTDPYAARNVASEDRLNASGSGSGSDSTVSESLTKYGDVIGSPAYMAPEQWTNPDQVDRRCDIYALGVLAYEAIAGRRPFHGTQRELAGLHLGAPLPPLPDALPSALHDALSHAMAKDRSDRPATALEFAREFRQASGLASEVVALPRLAKDVVDVALREYPQPIAEAVEELEGVSGAYRTVDAAARLLRVVVRWLAVVALAAWQSHPVRQGLSSEGAELLSALRKRKLSDAEWLELAVAFVTPYRFDPERHPVPPLVRLFFDDAEVIEVLTRVFQRRAARAESPLPAERAEAEEAQGLLEKAAKVLRGVSFLSDYLLAVVAEDGEAVLWMGARRRHRVTQPLPPTGGPWGAGSPLLLCGGERVVNLAPLAVVARPSPNAEPELFLADGQGRRGTLLVALPAGFERTSDAASQWLRHSCAASDDEADSAPQVLDAPYRGLAPLTASDADLFFGREHEAEAFLNRMRAEPLLVVVGPSGAGKSSFVRAGVVPALSASHRAIVFRPGPTPLVTLRAKLASLGISTEDLAGDASHAREVARRVHAGAHDRGETLVFFVDQFEETFTLARDTTERTAFSAWLSALASNAGDPVRLVLALRDDFLKNAQQEAAFRERLEHSLAMLATPDASVLRRILTEPARRAGFSFETEALADDMVHAVEGRPGALALLAFAASKLWEQRDSDTRTLERAAYEKMGGVVGALAHHGEEVLAQMTTKQRGLVRELFRRLVTADGTRAVTREDDLLRVLGGDAAARNVIERLVMGRLLVVRESEDGPATVEVIHESLFSSWSLLVEWRQQDAAGSRLLDQIRAAAHAWEGRGRSRSLLWRDELLDDYKRWRIHDRRGLTASEEAFAAASLADRERASRLRAAVIVLLAVAAVTTSYVAWQQSIARRAAQTATLDATRAEAVSKDATHAAEESAARARDAARLAAARVHADDPTMALALLRNLESPTPPRDWAPEIRAVLHAGVASAVYTGHAGPVWSVAFSPDGRWVVSGGVDTTVRVWNADGSGQVRVLRGHSERVAGVAVSGDGKRIASASRDGTIRIWNSDGSGEPLVLRGHEGGVMAVAFSPDDHRIVSGAGDATVRIWNSDGSGEPLVLRGHTGSVNGVAFSPDGRRVASSSSDLTARVWNADGSGSPLVLRGHTGRLRGIAFSPDGQRIATGAWDHTIRVWDLHGHGCVVLAGHGDVGGVAFSPDGRTIAAALGDQTWQIWNADGSGEPRNFRGDTDGLDDVAFSRDGTRVVSGGLGGDVRVWRVDLPEDPVVLGPQIDALEEVAVSPDGRLVATPSTDTAVYVWKTDGTGLAARLRGHTDQVFGVAFSPDGRSVAAGSSDETVRLWDLAHPEALTVLRGHTGDVLSVAFSPDGRTLVSGSKDHTLRLWDLSGASAPIVLRGHTDLVSAVAFSPDGRRIASASWDKTVRVWNADGSGSPLVLLGHTQAVFGVAFSPDGKEVASASSDGTVRLWNADGTGQPRVLERDSTEVDSVAFRPDGRVLAAAGVDNAIRLWNIDGSGEPVVLQGSFPAVFSPDGRRLFGLSQDNKLQVYADLAPLGPDDPRLWRATNLCIPPDKLVELLGVTSDVAEGLRAQCEARVAAAR